MTIAKFACSMLLAGTAALHAQEAVDLDAVEAPAPSRRAGDGIKAGDLKFNLYFDAMAVWSKSAGDDDTAKFRFTQQHQSLFARAMTPDGIEVLADILQPSSVFEATIPFRFFLPSLEGVPVLGEGGVKGGRMVVPFGDFEEHPIYGGSVSNSMYLREVIWSDYGMGLLLPWGKTKTELYAVNGIVVQDTSVWFGSASELNQLKGFGLKTRIDPMPAFFATASLYYDFLPRPEGDTLRFSAKDRAALAGLDLGFKFGALSTRLGAANGWISTRMPLARTDSVFDGSGQFLETRDTTLEHRSSYTKWGWYAEAKYRLSEHWSLRVRGGQVDPDSRVVGDDDLTNVNVSAIWAKGPVDCRLTYFRNFETHWPGSTSRPGNLHRVLLETFVSI